LQVLQRLKQWAWTIKRNVHAVWLASRDPRTPWYVRGLAISIAAYALSPFDLIPDFIPVLGLLDDAILLPLMILLVVRLIPADVFADCRARAAEAEDRPVGRSGAFVVAAIWLLLALLTLWFLYPRS
jgi:uncharacterized membrane protein YkvA (DUF1232 family)